MSLTGAKMRWKDWSGGEKPPQKKQLQHLNARWFAYNTFTFIVYLNVYTLKQKVYLQLNQSADPLFISLKKTNKKKNELVKWA